MTSPTTRIRELTNERSHLIDQLPVDWQHIRAMMRRLDWIDEELDDGVWYSDHI